jgi:hypothetical protein
VALDLKTSSDLASINYPAASGRGMQIILLPNRRFGLQSDSFAASSGECTPTRFKLIPMGSLEDFSASNKRDRAAYPEGEKELFPGWQAKQYLYSMFSVQNKPLDNDRYPDVRWTSEIDVISKI